MSEPSGAIDFSRYDLEGVRDEVLAIIDIGSAIADLVRRSALIPLVVFLIAWIIVGGLGGFFFAIIAGFLSLFPAVVVGGWLLSRQRLAAITTASERVVDTVSMIHRDIESLREGAAETSVHAAATGIVEEAVIPVVFGSATRFAGGLLGPLDFLAERVTAVPMRLVERSVVRAVRLLPDRTIGELGLDTVEAVASPDVDRLGQAYDDVASRLSGIVEAVTRGSTVVALAVAFVAAVPLLIWLAIGWWLG